jgi:predicted dehydrogenase
MIHGTKGSFIKHGEDPQEDLLKAGAIPTGPDWGKEEENNFGLIHTEKAGKVIREIYPSLKGSFGYYYDNLFKSIREQAPLNETAVDGYNVIRLIELAFESSEKKKTISISGLL